MYNLGADEAPRGEVTCSGHPAKAPESGHSTALSCLSGGEEEQKIENSDFFSTIFNLEVQTPSTHPPRTVMFRISR